VGAAWVQLGLDATQHETTDAAVVNAIARVTGGNFRLVQRLFAQLERIVSRSTSCPRSRPRWSRENPYCAEKCAVRAVYAKQIGTRLNGQRLDARDIDGRHPLRIQGLSFRPDVINLG